MRTFAFIVVVLALSLVFIVPFLRWTPRPPAERKWIAPPDLPKVYDLRSLDEKVEEHVRIMRAATQVTRQRRKTAEHLARMAWTEEFNKPTPAWLKRAKMEKED